MLAYHSIFGTYGFWLPNDPRGSGSDYIAVWELYRYGGATKVETRHSVAGAKHDVALRLEAKSALAYPPVALNDQQISAVVEGFAAACEESKYRIHACAVMPDHVHLVIGVHTREIRPLVGHLKSRATETLKEKKLWFDDDRPVWGEHGWNVYLNLVSEIDRAVAYTEANPKKEGRPAQHWSIVTPFDLAEAQQFRVARIKQRRLAGAALRSKQMREDGRR